jgi:hypothetical protein
LREITFFGFAGVPITTDIFIPELKLAFEYQGEQHFRDTGNCAITRASHCALCGMNHPSYVMMKSRNNQIIQRTKRKG